MCITDKELPAKNFVQEPQWEVPIVWSTFLIWFCCTRYQLRASKRAESNTLSGHHVVKIN